MSENSPNADRRDLLKKALQALDEMQAKVRALERSRTEPIAIVGMGCRFPGDADSPAALAVLRDSVTRSRCPSRPVGPRALQRADPKLAASCRRRARGFLSDVEGFDPGFFGISPREAVSMDPQQRRPRSELGSAGARASTTTWPGATGVFVGVTASDYWGI
jgi:myxalamid-type polyketide synthase MxaB